MSDIRICEMPNAVVPRKRRMITANFTLVPGVYDITEWFRPGETLDWIIPVSVSNTESMCVAEAVVWSTRPQLDPQIQTIDIFYRASHFSSVVLNKANSSITVYGNNCPERCFMVQLSINTEKKNAKHKNPL